METIESFHGASAIILRDTVKKHRVESMASKNWTANFSMSFLFWFGTCESHFSPASLTSWTASAWIWISFARISSLFLFSSSLMMLSRSIIGTSVDWFLTPVATSWGSFSAIIEFGMPALRKGYLAANALPPLGRKKSLRILLSFPPFDGFLTISFGGDDLCLLGGKDLLFPLPTLCLLGVLGNWPTLLDLRVLGISLSFCSRGVIRDVPTKLLTPGLAVTISFGTAGFAKYVATWWVQFASDCLSSETLACDLAFSLGGGESSRIGTLAIWPRVCAILVIILFPSVTNWTGEDPSTSCWQLPKAVLTSSGISAMTSNVRSLPSSVLLSSSSSRASVGGLFNSKCNFLGRLFVLSTSLGLASWVGQAGPSVGQPTQSGLESCLGGHVAVGVSSSSRWYS